MSGRVMRILATMILALSGLAGISIAAAGPAAADSRCTQNDTWKDNYGHYLDVKGGGGSGTPVITWYWNGGSNQHWCMEPANEGGWYFHPSYNLGLCLDVPHSDVYQGAKLWIFNCNGTGAQRFDVPNSGGYANFYTTIGTGAVDSSSTPGNAVFLSAEGDPTSWS